MDKIKEKQPSEYEMLCTDEKGLLEEIAHLNEMKRTMLEDLRITRIKKKLYKPKRR
jgi:hypothetical protein